MDIGRLVSLASEGLLSDNEFLFKEYLKVLGILFKHSSISDRQNKPERVFEVNLLYLTHSKPVVQNAVEVILSQKKNLFVEGCGTILQNLCRGEKCFMGENSKITAGFVYQTLKNHPLHNGFDKGIRDRFMDIIKYILSH
ncbi:hypothetical protein RF11_07500 [Thelohanellus kitauei]|uniref:Uncharacterized protein n=1 Tax=Thelohanellus kitauei TaxID=669202 RepID=A0A0C2I8P4_THEKT|nr:hypothetical protein RF11_07500 [Thelohanellus kitauei]